LSKNTCYSRNRLNKIDYVEKDAIWYLYSQPGYKPDSDIDNPILGTSKNRDQWAECKESRSEQRNLSSG